MIRATGRYPRGWEISSESYERILLKLPPEVTRLTASMRLSIEAEFGGWELHRVRLYTDGSRKVLLRRRRSSREAREARGELSQSNHHRPGEPHAESA